MRPQRQPSCPAHHVLLSYTRRRRRPSSEPDSFNQLSSCYRQKKKSLLFSAAIPCRGCSMAAMLLADSSRLNQKSQTQLLTCISFPTTATNTPYSSEKYRATAILISIPRFLSPPAIRLVKTNSQQCLSLFPLLSWIRRSGRLKKSRHKRKTSVR